MRLSVGRRVVLTCCATAAACGALTFTACSKTTAPLPPPPRAFTLATGTMLAIRTSHALSTNSQAAGDTFLASLAEPLVDGDWVIAKEGSEVGGLVVASTKGSRVKGLARLEVAITSLTLSDGQKIPVDTAADVAVARSTKGNDAKVIGITTGIGAAIGAIAGGGKGLAIGAAAGGGGGTAFVLGTRGKPAEIPANRVLHFRVTRAVDIVDKTVR